MPLARIDPHVLAQAAGLDPATRLAVVLRFEPGDGVRRATPMLRQLGFVVTAATPIEVAGDLPAGAVEQLVRVVGLVDIRGSVRRQS